MHLTTISIEKEIGTWRESKIVNIFAVWWANNAQQCNKWKRGGGGEASLVTSMMNSERETEIEGF